MMLFLHRKDWNIITQIDSGPRHRTTAGEPFGAFVEEHFATLYRFAFCMSLVHERAAELTETVFREARQTPPDGGADKQWMLTALHREWRGKQGMVSGGFPASASLRPDDRLISTDDAAACDQSTVLAIVHGMPAELRLVISLFYFEQFGYAAIAQILTASSAEVITRLAEAKMLLRRRMEEQRTHNGSSASPRVVQTKGGPSE